MPISPALTSFGNLNLIRVLTVRMTGEPTGEWSVKDDYNNQVGRIWRLAERMYEWEYGNPTDGHSGISGDLRSALNNIVETLEDGHPAC